jgi:hypothetical protein
VPLVNQCFELNLATRQLLTLQAVVITYSLSHFQAKSD